MEITNIYDFFHLLSVIKIRPNMDFGGDLAFAHICHNAFFFSLFFLKESGERFTMATIYLFISFNFFKLGFN
jgi:hypothetical protein